MGNPFTFSNAITGGTNQQIQNNRTLELAGVDRERATALNQLSEQGLNNQIAQNRELLRAALPNMNPRQIESVYNGLAFPDQASAMGKNAQVGQLQDAGLYSDNQGVRERALALAKAAPIYDQTSTGTSINNFTGAQNISDVDLAKAFDLSQQAQHRGATSRAQTKPFSPNELKTINNSVLSEGKFTPLFKSLFANKLDGESMPPEAAAYASMRINQLSQVQPDGTRLSAAEINDTLRKEINDRLKFNTGSLFSAGNTFDTVDWVPPQSLGQPIDSTVIKGTTYYKYKDGNWRLP